MFVVPVLFIPAVVLCVANYLQILKSKRLANVLLACCLQRVNHGHLRF